MILGETLMQTHDPTQRKVYLPQLDNILHLHELGATTLTDSWEEYQSPEPLCCRPNMFGGTVQHKSSQYAVHLKRSESQKPDSPCMPWVMPRTELNTPISDVFTPVLVRYVSLLAGAARRLVTSTTM